MVSGYTLTTFPNAIHAVTAATKSKGKSNNNNRQQQTQRVVHSRRGTGTAHFKQILLSLIGKILILEMQ